MNPIVTITAPAGFGKSTLIQDYISQKGVKCAWVSLDRFDNSLKQFFSYLVISIQNQIDGFGEQVLEMLNAPESMELNKIYNEFIDQISILSERLVIVLDDFHLIDNELIHEDLSYIIGNLPLHASIFILSREEVPINIIPKFRLSNKIIEINAQDLRFTSDETKRFFKEQQNLSISAVNIDALDKLIEGWVAGLQLISISHKNETDYDRLVQTHSKVDKVVIEYIASEVLNKLDDDLRDFIIQISVLSEFNGALCNYVLEIDNAHYYIDQLMKKDLFLIPLDQSNDWMRFHHLFGQFLLERFEKTASKEEQSKIHRKAADWFLENNMYDAAINRLLVLKDYHYCASIIEEISPRLSFDGNLVQLLKWIESLPKELLFERPKLWIQYVWLLALTSQLTKLNSSIQKFEYKLQQIGNDKTGLSDVINNHGYLGVIKAIIALHQGNYEKAVSLTRYSMMKIDQDDIPIRVVSYGNLGLANLNQGNLEESLLDLNESIRLSKIIGNRFAYNAAAFLSAIALINLGELFKANELYSEVLRDNETYGKRYLPALSMAQIGKSIILFEWNKIDEAYELCKQGLKLGDLLNNEETRSVGYLNMAEIFLAWNDKEKMHIYLGKAISIANSTEIKRISVKIKTEVALVLLRADEHFKLDDWVSDWRKNSYEELPLVNDNILFFLNMYYLKLNNIEEAYYFNEKLYQSAKKGGRATMLLKANLIKSIMLYRRKEVEESLNTMIPCIRFSKTQDYIRLFMIFELEIYQIISQLYDRDSKLLDTDTIIYFNKLFKAFEKDFSFEIEQLKPNVLDDPLTDREMEVLGQLAFGLKNKEIAEKLFISVGTIKTHVLKIYNKLDVRNRTEAITKAKDLGII